MIFKYVLSFLLIFMSYSLVYSAELDFNNGSENEYNKASELTGSNKYIQSKTKGLWPRKSDGQVYSVGENKVKKRENKQFLIIETNNLPDHEYHTNNPNCAKPFNFKFLIPKFPKILNKPKNITKKMQIIGVALNGVVIAGPYDSQNKIAPYNRQIDQCSAHADPAGMYHYHFSPLCLKGNIALDPSKQIGWSFDGYKIMGLADRQNHQPSIDTVTNGHKHNGEFHYHATVDFPFFIGAYKGKPESSNLAQKKKGKSSCPSDLKFEKHKGKKGKGKKRKGKRPNFEKAERVLGISIDEMKKALGPPPGDFSRAANKLGIDIKDLRDALDK